MIHERMFEQIRKTIENTDPYPGYPSTRLTLSAEAIDTGLPIDLPEGPWQINDTDLPSPEQTAAFVEAGYVVDAKGRPLHPGFREMVTDPSIGVVTGKGRYWNWGPNHTADPIVITKSASPRILLIRRGDTGVWALPGGFVDENDADAATAALRELHEEASLVIDTEPTEVYVGIVGDKRTTAHAWAETSAYLYRVDRQVPVSGADDATDARWFRLDSLQDTLFGAHGFLIEESLRHLEPSPLTPIKDMITKPKESLDIEIVQAGHMAYDHLFVRDENTTLFIKQHVPDRFSDASREAHSRAYLEKEAALYEYVAQRGYSFIPDRVELIDDTLLAMDSLHQNDGWLWRAPNDERFDDYVRDTLASFQQLQLILPPGTQAYGTSIEPTYTTLWKEGWDAIDATASQHIIAKIRLLSEQWTDIQKQQAEKLIGAFAQLLSESKEADRTPELFMAHNDARQSNIAWHKDQGTRLVDWSWGDPAPRNADATMFLIDLAKSGYDISAYKEHLNLDHARTLIGFWLAHSLWETRDGSTTVREQQVASAVSAYALLA